MTLTRMALLMLIAALLTGCADRARGVMQPVAVPAAGTARVDLVVATTRRASDNPAELFTGERGEGLAFANVSISIPPAAARQVGEIQWPRSLPPDPARDFAVLRAERVDRPHIRAAFRRLLERTPGRRVLVFVHGYNNAFENAVFGLAQIVHDSGAPVAPVLFTWPSRGRLFAYGYDRESTNYSRDALEEVLDSIIANPEVGEVSILAHSMGNWLTMETLRQMAIRRGRVPPKIQDVMLAAPDVDIDVFQRQIARIGDHRPRFTLFLSRDDRALAVSRLVWQSTARLGAINPNEEPYRTMLARDRVTVLDLTEVQTRDGLRHGKFAESPQVVQFIGRRLAEGQDLNPEAGGSAADRIGLVLTGTASTVGATAGAVLTAPLAIVDQRSRETLGDRIEEIGRRASSAAGAVP